jgi:hypothetical protein
MPDPFVRSPTARSFREIVPKKGGIRKFCPLEKFDYLRNMRKHKLYENNSKQKHKIVSKLLRCAIQKGQISGHKGKDLQLRFFEF